MRTTEVFLRNTSVARLAQWIDSHKKSTSALTRTLHYQLCVVTYLSFPKVKKPPVTEHVDVPSATINRIE